MKKLRYEVVDNGYHIYDSNDSLFHVYQYEPYIPDHSKTYAENAQAQIHGFMVPEYVNAVTSGEIALDDVPADYKEEVKAALGNKETYTLDEAATLLASEVNQ